MATDEQIQSKQPHEDASATPAPAEDGGSPEASAGEGAQTPRRKSRRRRGGRRRSKRTVPGGSEGAAGPERVRAAEGEAIAPDPEIQADAGVGGDAEPAEETDAPAAQGPEGAPKKRRRRRGGRRRSKRTGATDTADDQAAETPPAEAAPLAVEESAADTGTESGEDEEPEASAGDEEAGGVWEPPRAGAQELRQRLRIPDLDPGRAKRLIVDFLRGLRERHNLRRALAAVDGDLESAVGAALAVEALGTDRVDLLYFAEGSEQARPAADGARQTAERLHRPLETIDLQAYLRAQAAGARSTTPARTASWLAAGRQAYLTDLARERGALVLLTASKTRRLLTGERLVPKGVIAANPLGELYAMQVHRLARLLRVPGALDWKDFEKRHTYDEVVSDLEADMLLYQMVDAQTALTRLLDWGLAEEKVRALYRRLREAAGGAVPPSTVPVAEAAIARTWEAQQKIG